jgi:hypothetical protein
MISWSIMGTKRLFAVVAKCGHHGWATLLLMLFSSWGHAASPELEGAIASQIEAEIAPHVDVMSGELEIPALQVKVHPFLGTNADGMTSIANIRVDVSTPKGISAEQQVEVHERMTALLSGFGYAPAGQLAEEPGAEVVVIADVTGRSVLSGSGSLAVETATMIDHLDQLVGIAAVSALLFALIFTVFATRRRKPALPMPLGYSSTGYRRESLKRMEESADSRPEIASAAQGPVFEGIGPTEAARLMGEELPPPPVPASGLVPEKLVNTAHAGVAAVGPSAPGEWHRSALAKAAAESAQAKIEAWTFDQALSMLRKLDRHDRQQVLEKLPLHPSVKSSLARTLK